MTLEQTKKINILVIEDNHLDILVVKVLLEKDFNLHVVTNGYDALKELNEFSFDIILCDINLGDENMDGIRVAQLIRENEKLKDIKIFALTAHNENREFFVNKGFNDLMTKPVIKEEIIEIIENSYRGK
jgi:CheY-like chemotaxis protein